MTPSGTLWTAANAIWTQNMDGSGLSIAAGLMGCDGTGACDLGGTRVAWFSGDPLWATAAGKTRLQCAHPRNCVSIQSVSYDFSACTLTPYVGANATSFFPERHQRGAPSWYWPSSGVMLDGVLLVSTFRMEPAAGGFSERGTTIWVVANPSAAPSAWEMFPVDLADGSNSVFQHGTLIDGADGYLYVMGATDVQERAYYLARYLRSDAKVGKLDSPQWWMGSVRGFGYGRPRRFANDWPLTQIMGSDPFRVSANIAKRSSDWVMVGSEGFPRADLRYGLASTMFGPFPNPMTSFFTPPENSSTDGSGHLKYATYSGSGHTEQTWSGKGANDLLVAYAASEISGISSILTDTSIYWPRMVKATSLT